jgi:hypothetical protein
MARAKSTTSPVQPAAKNAAKRTLSAPPPTNLTEDQVHYCDLAADLLTCGGQPQLFGRLFDVLTQHEYARYSWTRDTDPTELPKRMREYANQDQPRNAGLKARLMNAWPAQIRNAKEPMPAHVRDIAATNIRNQLRYEFENFISETKFESLWLLWDVLNSVNGGENLAEAFNYQVHESGNFVQVPHHHEERVEQFLKTLAEVEKKKAA